jgi:hypothetical protein
MGLCDSRESPEGYKGVLGHSSITMSPVDALGMDRAREVLGLCKTKEPKRGEGGNETGTHTSKKLSRVFGGHSRKVNT